MASESSGTWDHLGGRPVDCTNIDGANGNEVPGHLNEPNLMQECSWAAERPIYRRALSEKLDGYTKVCGEESAREVIDLLRKRGLLTGQALELLQREGDLTPLPR